MKSPLRPKGRSENIVVRREANEFYVCDLSANRTFALDHRAASVWNLCDGTKSVAEIERLLAERQIGKKFISETLKQLTAAKLVSGGAPEEKLSRRGIFRKLAAVSAAVILGNLFSACGGGEEYYRGILPTGGGGGSDSAQTYGNPGYVIVTYVSSNSSADTTANRADCQNRGMSVCKSKAARLACTNQNHSCACVCD